MSAGRLVAIALRHQRRAPMQEIAEGLAGDSKGAKFPKRQITVLAREAWAAATAEAGDPTLPWTARRANLLIEGVELPKGKGGVLRIGPVRLEVTGQTYPCVRMEEACTGLLRTLARDWRGGGVTCRVLAGGGVRLDDTVDVLIDACEIVPRLPG